MIRFCALAAAAGLAAFTGLDALAESLPSQTYKVLTAALAVEAAQAAVAACKAQGYNITVTVADRTGLPKVVIVGDGISVGSVGRESTRRKAYTAAMRGVSTEEYTKRISAPGAFNPGLYDPQLATGAGGLPIKAGNETIGGISAAGAPGGDKDEACANAGIEKIKDRLN